MCCRENQTPLLVPLRTINGRLRHVFDSPRVKSCLRVEQLDTGNFAIAEDDILVSILVQIDKANAIVTPGSSQPEVQEMSPR